MNTLASILSNARKRCSPLPETSLSHKVWSYRYICVCACVTYGNIWCIVNCRIHTKHHMTLMFCARGFGPQTYSCSVRGVFVFMIFRDIPRCYVYFYRFQYDFHIYIYIYMCVCVTYGNIRRPLPERRACEMPSHLLINPSSSSTQAC